MPTLEKKLYAPNGMNPPKPMPGLLAPMRGSFGRDDEAKGIIEG